MKLCSVCDETDIVTLTSEIDITGKDFSITCLENENCPSEYCSIQGSGGHRLFSGAPQKANFDSIQFRNGEGADGGAFHLTGGATNFNSCGFLNNKATAGDGGALYVSGSSTKVTLTGTGESTYNGATYGAFLLATNGASIVIDSVGAVDSLGGISLNIAEQSGGLLAAMGGSNVTLQNMEVRCGNQAKNGGDYFFIQNDASVECQAVTFQVLATSTVDEQPPPFYSEAGIIGNSPTCKASTQVGEKICKRQN